MKAKYFLIAVLLVSFTAFAQQGKATKEVQNSFTKLYPKATDVKWDKEGKGYEASFKNDGKHISVVFDAMGNALETETVIETSMLPKDTGKYISTNYNGYKITEAAKIVDAKGIVTYEAEITKGKVKKDVLFDSDGKPLKKESKESDEEKEDDEDKD